MCVLLACVLWTRDRVKIRVEPMENQRNINTKESLDILDKMKESVKGPLNLADNHALIQDLILDYDQWAGYKMLSILRDADNIEKNIKSFNDLTSFKKNLNDALAFLDKS
jgi:hypothetical protein